MKRDIRCLLYGAGNFVLLNDFEKEQKFVKEVIKRMGKCNRLASFFFTKEMDTVLKVIKKGEK